MPMLSCPGAVRIKDPIPEFFTCPKCGADVEIWTHENARKCTGCGLVVYRDQVPTCIEWCEYGKECVGEEAYNRYMKAKGGNVDKKALKEEEKKMKLLMETVNDKCKRRNNNGEETDNQDR